MRRKGRLVAMGGMLLVFGLVWQGRMTAGQQPATGEGSAVRSARPAGSGDYRRDAYAEVARLTALINGPEQTSLRSIATLATQTEASAREKLASLIQSTSDFWTPVSPDLQKVQTLAKSLRPSAQAFTTKCESVARAQSRIVSLNSDAEERRAEIDQRLAAANAAAGVCRTKADADRIRENYNAASRLHSGLDGLVRLVGQAALDLPPADSPFAQFHQAVQTAKEKLRAALRTLDESETAVTTDADTAQQLLEGFRAAQRRIAGEITAAKRRFAVPPADVTDHRLPAQIAGAFDAVRRNLQGVSEPAVASVQFAESVETAITEADAVRQVAVNFQTSLIRGDCQAPVLTAEEMATVLTQFNATVRAAKAAFTAAADLPRKADQCDPPRAPTPSPHPLPPLFPPAQGAPLPPTPVGPGQATPPGAYRFASTEVSPAQDSSHGDVRMQKTFTATGATIRLQRSPGPGGKFQAPYHGEATIQYTYSGFPSVLVPGQRFRISVTATHTLSHPQFKGLTGSTAPNLAFDGCAGTVQASPPAQIGWVQENQFIGSASGWWDVQVSADPCNPNRVVIGIGESVYHWAATYTYKR